METGVTAESQHMAAFTSHRETERRVAAQLLRSTARILSCGIVTCREMLPRWHSWVSGYDLDRFHAIGYSCVYHVARMTGRE